MQLHASARQAVADAVVLSLKAVGTETEITAKEPSWHRRARRSRSRARQVLRNFLTGYSTASTTVVEASNILNGHHSKSFLPERALRKLEGENGEWADIDQQKMTAQYEAWYCSWCRRTNSPKVAFCPGCGYSWRDIVGEGTNYTGARQKETPWNWEVSSPKHRTTQSPRRRWIEDGKSAGKTSGKRQVPVPPPVPPSTGKGKGKQVEMASATAGGSSAELQLSSLVSALAEHQESLPPKLREIVHSHQGQNASAQAKALHKNVAAQASAAKQLAGLRAKRSKYLTEWQSYVKKLGETLQQQLEEKAAILAGFDAEEDVLQDALETAKSAVLTLAGGEAPAEDAMEAEAAEDDTSEARQKLKLQEEALQKSVAVMQQDAEQEKQREGSRTPRRHHKLPDTEAPDGSSREPFGAAHS